MLKDETIKMIKKPIFQKCQIVLQNIAYSGFVWLALSSQYFFNLLLISYTFCINQAPTRKTEVVVERKRDFLNFVLKTFPWAGLNPTHNIKYNFIHLKFTDCRY